MSSNAGVDIVSGSPQWTAFPNPSRVLVRACSCQPCRLAATAVDLGYVSQQGAERVGAACALSAREAGTRSTPEGCSCCQRSRSPSRRGARGRRDAAHWFAACADPSNIRHRGGGVTARERVTDSPIPRGLLTLGIRARIGAPNSPMSADSIALGTQSARSHRRLACVRWRRRAGQSDRGEEVRGPSVEGDVQALHLRARRRRARTTARERVAQAPGRCPQLVAPRNVDARLRRRIRQVHHDELSRARSRPAPGDQPAVGVVVRPTGALAQAPVTVAERGSRRSPAAGARRTSADRRPPARPARARGTPGYACGDRRTAHRGTAWRPGASTSRSRPRAPSPARTLPPRAARRGSR